MLRDQQAGFRRNRSCADQIASLRIIVEQSLEWNSPLYINFIDYEKAFDSVDREALWKLLRHYGVPGKIISLIQCTYKDMSCRIAHAGQLSESFEVKTGVRQGCLLSPFLFLLVIDWIMKTTTTGRKNGIQWTLWTQLDDLDFADDLALLSHSHSQMQDKTTCLEATSAGTGLKINRRKTELMKINTTANTPVTVGGEPIREVESFVYLGSVVDGQGGTDRDVTARIGKARAAMVMLKNIWASKVVSIRTKLRIFNSNVKSVLLYGCETWRTTKTMQQKIQTFLNTCLRRIFNIRWPEKIRNEELWERAGQEPAAKQILRRKWGWIGHTLRKPASSTTRQALTWNPQGKRKRGRPRNSWRRDTEAELYKQGTNWTGVARIAQNRVRWRRVVDGLCSTWSQGPNVKPFSGGYGFDSKLGSGIPGGDMGPAWQGRSIAGPKLRMVEFSAFLEQQRDPDSAVDIRQIYDKFPEKKGGLKELYDKGPQSAFFLVKFWADINTNVQDETGAFYGVTSQYESSENMTIQVSTKVCSFGKQVVEKVETEYPRFENGRFMYRIHRSPMCEYMINFIHKLKHLPEKYMMNSVLENFTILQVVTNRDTQETLLCIAFVFEVSSSEHGAQHHIYKLVKD
nr:hypothetical protein BaRGS_032097 [Batillaria attramentaria]